MLDFIEIGRNINNFISIIRKIIWFIKSLLVSFESINKMEIMHKDLINAYAHGNLQEALLVTFICRLA